MLLNQRISQKLISVVETTVFRSYSTAAPNFLYAERKIRGILSGMIQRTFTAKTADEVRTILASMRECQMARHGTGLLQIYDTAGGEAHLSEVVAAARETLPDAKIVGATISVGLGDFRFQLSGTLLSFILFEESTVEVLALRKGEGTERELAERVRRLTEATEGARGVLVLASGFSADIGAFLESAYSPKAGASLFGMQAGITEWNRWETGESAAVFTGTGEILREGFLAVVLAGKNLKIRTHYNFGWHGIGKRMTVTGKRGKIVSTIDGKPAANVYRKYLGISGDPDTIASNVCEFPLVLRSGNREIARIAVSSYEDGGIYFPGEIREGETIRISYGNVDDILSETYADSREVAEFRPQAAIVVSCGNRNVFMRSAADREIGFYESALPDTLSLHGFSELLYDGEGGGVLNSALVSVAMREGDGGRISCEKDEPKPKSEPNRGAAGVGADGGVIPLHRRLANFIAATTGDLEEMAAQIQQYNERLEQKVDEKTAQLAKVQDDIILNMASAVESRDANTGGHIRRTSDIVRLFVRRLSETGKFPELNSRMATRVIKAAPLHDFGKIGIPDRILNKPGKFEPEEYEIMKQHSEKGAVIVSAILSNSDDAEFRKIAVNVAYYHHEKWNGQGYPKGLRETEIPFEARIMALADVFDALVSRRVYKDSFSYDKAFSIIAESSGTHFDPSLVPEFLKCRPELEALFNAYDNSCAIPAETQAKWAMRTAFS